MTDQPPPAPVQKTVVRQVAQAVHDRLQDVAIAMAELQPGDRQAFPDLAEDEQAAFLDIADAAIKEHLVCLMAGGWRLVPPDNVLFPESRKEAEAMVVVGQRYMQDHILDVPKPGLLGPSGRPLARRGL